MEESKFYCSDQVESSADPAWSWLLLAAMWGSGSECGVSFPGRKSPPVMLCSLPLHVFLLCRFFARFWISNNCGIRDTWYSYWLQGKNPFPWTVNRILVYYVFSSSFKICIQLTWIVYWITDVPHGLSVLWQGTEYLSDLSPNVSVSVFPGMLRSLAITAFLLPLIIFHQLKLMNGQWCWKVVIELRTEFDWLVSKLHLNRQRWIGFFPYRATAFWLLMKQSNRNALTLKPLPFELKSILLIRLCRYKMYWKSTRND